jgi:hypothetical protein
MSGGTLESLWTDILNKLIDSYYYNGLVSLFRVIVVVLT